MGRNRFLITSLANAATTANALRPVSRSGGWSVPSWASGLVTSELPLQAAGFQAALAAVTAGRGSARGLRGKLGLAANAASGLGLLGLHVAARRSKGVLEAALVDELGSDYRARISEPFSPTPEAALRWRRVVAPDFGVRRRYRVGRNLSYGEFGRRNRLDVWRRADLPRDARAPVLFQVHGGAWVMGRKEGQAEPLMGHLAERGWVCVAANYRLSPRATWPDHIVDVKRALAWVKANIADHGGDPDFVVITGGSAGGHLSSLAALTHGVAAFQPGFEHVDLRVAAAVPFYGVYDFVDRYAPAIQEMAPFLEQRVFKTKKSEDRQGWEQASPISHVRADAPPFFVIHGTNDSLVPVEQARYFVDDLRKASQCPVVYAELPLTQHAFDILPSVRTHHTVHAVERFLAVVRSEHGGPTPAEAVTSSS